MTVIYLSSTGRAAVARKENLLLHEAVLDRLESGIVVGRRVAAAWWSALGGLAFACLLVLASASPSAASSGTGVGIGILSVDGASSENFTLVSGGPYYLTVAPDASSFVNMTLAYAGSVLAQTNRTVGESTPVSLPAGNYTVTLMGRGRAALGWDLTNGALQEFPVNQTLVGFLVPAGPRLQVTVALGDAQLISLHVYDGGLLPAGNATVAISGPVDFVLPTSSDGIAYLTATVISGNPNGVFGLSWSSGPLNPPIDLAAWPFFLLWILVPVAIALAVFVIVHRRGSRGRIP